MIKTGIDSYSFHRYFGEIRAETETDPGKRWEVSNLISFAAEHGAGGVSLETCYMPGLDASFLRDLKDELDERGLERVLAWGHPVGLKGGKHLETLRDLIAHIPSARAIGAKTMRITASGGPYIPESEAELIANVTPDLREAARAAADQGIVLALENHGDFTSQGLLHVLDLVDSPFLRITLDTGNAQRCEDAVEATRRLAPFVVATHTKDISALGPQPGRTAWSVPIGKGVVDIPAIVRLLHQAGYDGLLCIEIDALDPAWRGVLEEELVTMSLDYLGQVLSTLA